MGLTSIIMRLPVCLCKLGHALILVICLLERGVTACEFPEFIQTNPGNRDWQGQIKSQNTEFTLTLTINENKMSVVSTDSSATTYDRICLQALSDNRFLTAHEQRRQRSHKFVCMQFIKRSDNVVQLRESQIVGFMAGVCDLDLYLDPWILVDKNRVLEHKTPCPFIGGYSVKLFDKEYQMGLCDAYKDHVRMESECVAGSGLYFNFRYNRCIPNILMSRQQRTMCLANWTEGSNTFVLIRHDTHSYIWIMRYPTDQQHLTSFVAYLMKDLYAAIDTHITEIDTYVQMDMVRDTPHPVSSLCTDEFEGCDYYSNPCAKGGDIALTCARTCGVCNETRPVVCNFDSAWQGDWIDATHGDRVAATFEAQVLTIFYNKINQKFHCIRWDEPYSGPTIKHTTYKMLVTEFSNGCRPQYSCAKVVHRTSSAVMFIQLSSERHWPFTSRVTEPVNCNNFDFEGDTNTLMPNRYRSKHYRLLYSETLDKGTACNIPLNDVRNYTVTLSGDTMCSGRLMLSTSGSSISVSINECTTDSSAVTRIAREHVCVESSRLFNSDLLVVSRTDEEPYQLYCWLFPKRTRDAFYLVESAHCNANTKRGISRGHIQPLATFSTVPPTQSGISHVISNTPVTRVFNWTQWTVETTQKTRKTLRPEEDLVVEMTPSVVNNDNNFTSSKENNSSTTNHPSNPAITAGSIAAVAAILFLIVFQISCMCRNH